VWSSVSSMRPAGTGICDIMLLSEGFSEIESMLREKIVGVVADGGRWTFGSILVVDGVGPNFQCSGPKFSTL